MRQSPVTSPVRNAEEQTIVATFNTIIVYFLSLMQHPQPVPPAFTQQALPVAKNRTFCEYHDTFNREISAFPTYFVELTKMFSLH